MRLHSLIPPLLFIVFFGCVENSIKKATPQINIKDTIYENKTFFIQYGDTIWQQDIVYFIPTNPTTEISNFFYEASMDPWNEKTTYKIYFQRDDVIKLTDSMLHVLSPRKQDDFASFHDEIRLFEHLKRQAVNNKIDEVIFGNELPVLLENIKPLVINQSTRDTPQYLIVKQRQESVDTVAYSYGYDLMTSNTYYIKNKFGDTILLSTGRIKDVPIKTPK